MDTTLTNLEHAASYLPDRTRLDDVADALYPHLRTATLMIAAYTGLRFDYAPRVMLLDTPATHVSTPGAAPSPFARGGDEAVFSLPVSGALSGLIVRYRGGYTFDRDFDWSTVEPLVANEDFIYQEATGRLRLLFGTEALVDGLRVEFTTGYATQPEVLLGSRREEFFSRMGLETTLAPLVRMFTGVEQKMVSDSASAPGAPPVLAEVLIQPPEIAALHDVVLYTPRDAALVSVPQALTLDLHGIAANAAETLLHTTPVLTALQGQKYTLGANPAQTYARYRLRVSGAEACTVAVSSISLRYADPQRVHMQSTAPASLTEACAMLAAFLMGRGMNDGLGKESDTTDRAYASGTIPREIRAMLSPYRSTTVRFI